MFSPLVAREPRVSPVAAREAAFSPLASRTAGVEAAAGAALRSGEAWPPPGVEGPARAWVGVVSYEHVKRGVAGGFAQLCHGRRAPLVRMAEGDWLVYYSPRVSLDAGGPLRAFTAIGRVKGGAAYAFDMGGGFVPFRRDVSYVPCEPAPLARLAPALRFVREPGWGLKARRGHFEIGLDDLRVIAAAMGAR
ncbi:MAG TPA: EVE domain-containing protein [Polyangiaceae bacterium]|nr:EVE domain-containing protein [Polyangiaceae bacterium]